MPFLGEGDKMQEGSLARKELESILDLVDEAILFSIHQV